MDWLQELPNFVLLTTCRYVKKSEFLGLLNMKAHLATFDQMADLRITTITTSVY